MNKTQRGLKVATMLLSLIAAGVAVDSGSLFGQSHSTHIAAPVTMNHNGGSVVMDHHQGSVVMENGAGCSSCNAAAAEVIYTNPAPVYIASAASSCGCTTGCKSGCTKGCKRGCKHGCTSCRKKKVSCPSCDCEFCELEVSKGEVEKTRYTTEQKEVCVPAVRLPWKKNCPPKRSKVRTVRVLKKEKYKCPKCEYKWSVHEPEDFSTPEPADSPVVAELKEAADQPNASDAGSSIYSDPADALGDVPRPPLEK